jgi:hypothetical protein
VKIKGEFKKRYYGKSIFEAPTGFKEIDLRTYSILGTNEIAELLNDLIKWHNFEHLEKIDSGNTMVQFDDNKDNCIITQYRIEREWIAGKKDLVSLYKKLTKKHR